MKKSEMMIQYFISQISKIEAEIEYRRERRFVGCDEYDLFMLIESIIEKRVLDRVMRDYILIYKLDRTSERENNQK